MSALISSCIFQFKLSASAFQKITIPKQNKEKIKLKKKRNKLNTVLSENLWITWKAGVLTILVRLIYYYGIPMKTTDIICIIHLCQLQEILIS